MTKLKMFHKSSFNVKTWIKLEYGLVTTAVSDNDFFYQNHSWIGKKLIKMLFVTISIHFVRFWNPNEGEISANCPTNSGHNLGLKYNLLKKVSKPES